jgi:prepilin-type N-terminal cleavage/methylation domain-containing protein
MNCRKNRNGFTLVELLIVIAIIAIMAAAVYVALDPLRRFQDSRDSRRSADVESIISALKLYQVDNKGANFMAINFLTAGNVYMMGSAMSGCNGLACDTPVTSSTSCVNIAGLANAGYLASMPISPNGVNSYGVGLTGYTISRASNGIITIRSCESENTDEILASR